jgi:hypothetical protein
MNLFLGLRRGLHGQLILGLFLLLLTKATFLGSTIIITSKVCQYVVFVTIVAFGGTIARRGIVSDSGLDAFGCLRSRVIKLVIPKEGVGKVLRSGCHDYGG